MRRNMAQERESRLGVWEKYLSLWVALCIGAGIEKVSSTSHEFNTPMVTARE